MTERTPKQQRRLRFAIIFQAVIVFVLLVGALLLSVQVTRLNQHDEEILEYRGIQNDISVNLLFMQTSLQGYLVSGDSYLRDEYTQRADMVSELIQRSLGGAPVDDKTLDEIQLLSIAYDTWETEYGNRILTALDAGNRGAALTLLEEGQSELAALIAQSNSLRQVFLDTAGNIKRSIGLVQWLLLGTIAILGTMLLLTLTMLRRLWREQNGLLGDLKQVSEDLQTSNNELQQSTEEQMLINDRLRTRVSETRLINDINERLAAGDFSSDAYNMMAERIGTLLGGWCAISRRLPAPQDNLMDLMALYHPVPSMLEAIRDWIKDRPSETTVGLHAPIFTDNQKSVVMLEVPRSISHPDDLPPELAPIADLINLTSYIAVPILINNKPQGVISVSSSTTGKYFDADQELFLEQVADRIASWMESERLNRLLATRAAELQTSFDSITDIMITYDAQGERLRINRTGRKFLGLDSGRVLEPSETLWHRVNGQPLPLEEHPVTLALAGENITDIELAIPNSAHEMVIHTVSTAPLRDADGAITGAILVARDLTARKELDRLKEEFLANMSHELRTPLTAILGYSELLIKRRAEVLTPWHVNKIEGIRSGGQRLLSLVNDLLDVAKLDAGQVQLELRDADLHTIIQTQYQLLQPNIAAKRLRVRRELAPQVPVMRIDADRISQVLMNLLSNAIKFTPDEGTITLSTGSVTITETAQPVWLSIPLDLELPAMPDGHYAVVAVSDTGVGIPQESLPHLWDRFYQAEGGSSRRFGGTGLGLSIVQQLVELHGGRVWAASNGLDRGSTFAFILPINPSLVREELPYHHQGATILMVEDDLDTARIFEQHLHDAGFNVIHARNGHEAIQWAEKLQPAAITLDLALPDSDGWGILAALRQIPHLVDTPVVIASINDKPPATLGFGVSTYLVKPVAGERLISVIKQLVGQSSLKRSYVMVVDDDADMVDLLQSTLNENGYHTRAAYDGSIAIDMLQEEELPSLILLDLMMPVIDGFQLLARIRDEARTRTIPVIIVTARDLTPEEVHQLRYAAQGIQAKHNLDMESLVAEVQRHISYKEGASDGGADDSYR